MPTSTSVGGLRGARDIGHYVSAEHGMIGLMHTFALELGEHSVRVNALCPWPCTSCRPRVEPEDISDAVAFPASDESRFIAGVALPIDTGNLLR